MNNAILTVDLGLDATNQDIIDQMKIMKECRESGIYGHIVCTIRGFGEDPGRQADPPWTPSHALTATW